MDVRNMQIFKQKPKKNIKKDTFENEILPNKEDETFTNFIRSVMRDENRPGREKGRITNKKLGDRLNLSEDMCTKVINMQKDNQSRDCIIAICIALDMTVAEANKALFLYHYTPRLDRENPRDNCLMNILENNEGAKKEEWIENANCILKRMRFEPLLIIKHRKSSQKRNARKKRTPSKKMRESLKVQSKHINSTINEDPYCSLSTAWDLWLFRVNVQMWVFDEEKDIKYLLSADGDGRLDMFEFHKDSIIKSSTFSSPDEADEFTEYFSYLLGDARNKTKQLRNHLDDTRNYYKRTGADVQDDSVCIFVERYNYSMSERHEFYLMERANGKHRLSVFHESAFMSRYLGEVEYQKQYEKKPPSPIMVFESIEDATENDEKCSFNSLRKKAFVSLASETDTCLERIRNGNLHIRNWENMFDDEPDAVCRFFGVEKEFRCRIIQLHPWLDEEPELNNPDSEKDGVPFLIAEANEADFTMKDGTVVTVTLDQLRRAFDLGCKDIEQICRIIAKTGTLDVKFPENGTNHIL